MGETMTNLWKLVIDIVSGIENAKGLGYLVKMMVCFLSVCAFEKTPPETDT